MTHDTTTQAAMDMDYTSSKGKVSRLGDLPLPYLRNIGNQLAHHGETGPLLDAVNLVIDAKVAELETAMQNRGEV